MKLVSEFYNTVTLGGWNAGFFGRTARVLAMAALAAAAVGVAQALPGIDFPGESDALIVSGLTALLAGVDKWARAGGDTGGESGQINLGGSGLLGLIALILIIVCAVVWLWLNIDVNEDPAALLPFL